MSKSYKKLVLMLAAGCVLLTFARLSKAIWNDSEIIGFNVSFLSSYFSQDLIINVQNENLTQDISEKIHNVYFQYGLDSWNYQGKVKIIADSANKNYLAIGESYNSNLISENCIFQDVELTKGPVHFLITYEYFSQDDFLGFDQVAFAVLINDEIIHLESTSLNRVGLKQSLIYYLVPENNSYQLKICAGNTGDRLNSSWIHLHGVSTYVAAVNPLSNIKVTNFGHEICASYYVNNEPFESCSSNQLFLSFTDLLDNKSLSITSGNEVYELPIFVFPNPPNTVEGSRVCMLNNQRLALFLTADPEKLQNINLRYSQDFDNNHWDNYQETQNVYLDYLLELQRSFCVDNRCLLFFNSLAGDYFSESQDLSILLKNCDPSGQCSEIFKPALYDTCEDLFNDNLVQPILLNEIMFNPLGDDKGDWYEGEWVELYNPNSFEVDLSGYRIEDEAGWQVFLSSSNCDNNFHVDDLGETIIEPLGFLIVFMRGRAILNNSGDSVYLYNGLDQLIDSVHYSGSSQENTTYGRYFDGMENWIMGLCSTPLEFNRIDM